MNYLETAKRVLTALSESKKTPACMGETDGEPSGPSSDSPADLESGSSQVEVDEAVRRLNHAGVRIMRLDGSTVIGIWRDVDGPEIRSALRTLGMREPPVRFLDDDGVPPRHKIRKSPDLGHAS